MCISLQEADQMLTRIPILAWQKGKKVLQLASLSSPHSTTRSSTVVMSILLTQVSPLVFQLFDLMFVYIY